MSDYERKHVYNIQTPSANGKKQENSRQSCTYLACYHGPVNSVVTMAGWTQKEDSKGRLCLGTAQTESCDSVCWLVYFGVSLPHTEKTKRKSVEFDLISYLWVSLGILPSPKPTSFRLPPPPHLWKQMILSTLKGRRRLGVSLLWGQTAGWNSGISRTESVQELKQ